MCNCVTCISVNFILKYNLYDVFRVTLTGIVMFGMMQSRFVCIALIVYMSVMPSFLFSVLI